MSRGIQIQNPNTIRNWFMKKLTPTEIQRTLSAYVCACSALMLLTVLPLRSQIVFDYVKIADNSTPIPNGTGNFGGYTLPANNGSNVVFLGLAGSQQGIYRSAGGVLTPIADTNTPAHGGQPNRFLREFGTPSVRGIGVAFYVNSGSGPAIYRSSGGALEVIASVLLPETPIPSSTESFQSFGAGAGVSASGELVGFVGSGFVIGGLYAGGSGGLSRIADNTMPIPSGTGNFAGFAPPSIDGNRAAFRGFRGVEPNRQEGIYLESAGIVIRLADTNTAIPSGTGRFTSFENSGGTGEPTAQGGRVAFRGLGANGQVGIYVSNGGTPIRVANTSTPIPAGTGNFEGVRQPSLDGENLAFVGARGISTSRQRGIYLQTGLNGALHKVADRNTLLNGRRPEEFYLNPEALSGSSIAFAVSLPGSMNELWVAVRNYALFSATSGSWDDATNWLFGKIPGTNVPVILNPGTGLTLTGPAAAASIHSLIVSNSGAGPTTFQLQNSGPLTAAQGVIIGANGILAGNGSTALGSNATVQIVGSASALAAVSPGASLGTLALGTPGNSNRVVFGNHSELRAEINQAGQSDQLTIHGHLDLSSDLDALNISVTDSASGDYTLVTYSGTRTGTFNTVTGLPSGYSVDYSQPGQIILKAGQGDTDSDGIPDAFELQYATNLTVLSATGDADGDGQTDVGEYAANTNPLDPASRFEVTGSSFSLIQNERQVSITWASSLACRYRIEETAALGDSWQVVLDNIVPDAGAVTTRSLMRPAASGGFFRVRATRSGP